MLPVDVLLQVALASSQSVWRMPLTPSLVMQDGGPAAAGARISGAGTGVYHLVLAGNAAAACAGCATPTRWAARL